MNLIMFVQLVLVASIVAFLAISQKGRDRVLRGLHLRKRRGSGAQTPPRSLTPDSKDRKSSQYLYRDVFPPSRRCAFETCEEVTFKALGKASSDLAISPPDSRLKCLPIDMPFDDADSDAYTCTEFSVREVKAFGNFPDYAGLSGVPLPQPYHAFDIKTAKPRPYRPFRWMYHQTMSLTRMEPDWWLEVESTYVDRVKQRKELFSKHGKAVLDYMPGSELPCKELMEMILVFLSERYPQCFELDKENMLFHNHLMQSTSKLSQEHPLHVIMDNCPEDFAIMLRDPDTGLYRFRAGIICSSLGWSLGSKFGMHLHEIHAPIPDYKEKMQFSMDRYFAKKPTEKAIQRGSWGLEIDEPLFMPPGDPHEKHREVQHEDLELSRLNLRVDWQTLRRLPLSGAIVFNFKALFTPVEEFRDEAYIPSLILKVLREGKRNMMEYKNTWHTEHKVIPALEAYEKEQIQKGLIPENWEPHTLDESPFFPDWEQKWHRQQGF